jgi:hypothetical protein
VDTGSREENASKLNPLNEKCRRDQRGGIFVFQPLA